MRSSPFGKHGHVLRHWLRLSTRVVAVGLFLIVHLWMNARGMQGRHAFEAAVVPVLESGAFAGFAFLFVFVPLVAHAGLRFTAPPSPGVPRSDPRIELVTFAGCVLFVATLGYAYGVRLGLGHLSAFDVHPELCTQLSTTTAQGIPVAALGYVAGLAAAHHQLATGLRECWAAYRKDAAPVTARRAVLAIHVACAVLFAAAFNGVLYFATGAPLF